MNRRQAAPTSASVLAVLVALDACAGEEPQRPTSQLVPELWVEQPDGEGTTHYEALFRAAPGGRALTLDEGDVVRVTSDAAPEAVLAGDGNPRGEIYRLEREDPPLAGVTFALVRATGGSAPRSTVSFAPALAGFAPSAGATIAYGDGSARVRMTWTNELADATITFVSHACDRPDDHGWSRPLPDKGAIELSTREIVVGGAPTGPTCLRLQVRRGLSGTLDPAFVAPGGTITAYVTHTATVTVVP